MSDEDVHDDDELDDDDRDTSPPASEKQLNYIRVLQKQVGLSDEELTTLLDEVTGVAELETLTIKKASMAIDQLRIEAKERGIDLDSQPKASEKQVKFIKSLKRRAQLTQDEFSTLLEEVGGVSEVEEIGKRDASAMIDELLALADGLKSGAAKKKTKPNKKAAKKAPEPEPQDDGEYDDDVPF